MKKALRGIRISTLVVVVLESLLLTIAFVLYSFNVPSNIQTVMTIDKWLMGFGVIFVIDAILIWLGVSSVAKKRDSNDLKAATLIGQDVQEAYDFGQIGLAVTDADGQVYWTNNLFETRHVDILDQNIYEAVPGLDDIKDGMTENATKVELSGHTYDVRLIRAANIFIFKDTTLYETTAEKARNDAVVFGTIVIDNYNDLTGTDDEENSEMMSKVRGCIFDYADKHGVFLRRYRNDSYLAVCDYAALKAMENDEFWVLNSVRAIKVGTDLHPTLSIGFAHGYPNVNKTSDMASDALDIATSRGGDQAVVAHCQGEMKFYGGKSIAFESTSRVKVRSIADSLLALIKQADNVMVMGHTDMDMDALGSCLGIRSMCRWVGKDCSIIYDQKQAERKTKFAFKDAFTKSEFDKMTISTKEAVEQVKEGTLVIVTDVSNPKMVIEPKVLEKASKVIVIDHHRRGETFIEKPVLAYIEPSASSACEIVAELVKYSSSNPKIVLDEKTATIMLSGIFLDTNFFKGKTAGLRTFTAAEVLKSFGADNSQADEYLKDEFEEFTLITKIISTLKTPYYGVVYCVAEEEDSIERATLAKVANQVMQLKGVDACFVIGRTGPLEVRISARSAGSVNVQLLTEKMGGGGHFTGAAAVFSEKTVKQVEDELLGTLEDYLSAARSSKQQ